MNIGIFTGGKHAPKKVIRSFLKKNKIDYIIAADSGLEKTDQLNLLPNYIIGDFDSLKNKELLDKYKNIEIKHFPQDKDFTDTELAMQFATKVLRRYPEGEIIVFGAGGAKRLDHLIYFLRIFKTSPFPSKWLFDSGVAFCICSKEKKSLQVKLPINTTLSVFSISIVKNIKSPKLISDGLHWELNELDWEYQQSISNRSDKEVISLSAIEGRFLLIINGHKTKNIKQFK